MATGTTAELKRILRQVHSGNLSLLKKHRLNNPDEHWKNIKYASGDTILHIAARLGNAALVDYLLDEYTPCVVDCRNNDNKTPLHEAAQFAQLKTCKSLLDRGADVNALKKADWTPLMLACTKTQASSVDVVELLLQRGALPNVRNKDGWTALHLTAREGNVEILRVLRGHNVDEAAKTANGRSALHICALHGHIDFFNALNYDNVNLIDNCGNTPLREAVLGGNFEMFQKVLSAGGDLKSRNFSGYNILHLAASVGALEIIDFVLLNYPEVDVNAIGANGETALHCAARKGQVKAYEALVRHGASESLKDLHGRVAQDYQGAAPELNRLLKQVHSGNLFKRTNQSVLSFGALPSFGEPNKGHIWPTDKTT